MAPKTEENYKAAVAMLEQELAKRTLDIKSAALGTAKVRYEELRENLIIGYKQGGVKSLYERKDGSIGIMGLNWLDAYFSARPSRKWPMRFQNTSLLCRTLTA